MRAKKIYLISGEVSGDTHGAELMHAIQSELSKVDLEVEFFGYGGPEMRQAGGGDIRDWIEKAAVMGIVEVLKHYRWFKKQFHSMLDELKQIQPDALILIDYPGFNLRMAKAVRKALPATKIIYYVSPQVWAWNKGRIPKMAAILDKMLCILPFEKPLYENSGLSTTFVGHPVVDELVENKIDVNRDPNLIGLFPGSREREISRLFPVMLDAARRMRNENENLRFQAPAATEKLAELMQKIIDKAKLTGDYIQITSRSDGGSHKLMQQAHCGVIASGTATLEAAWYGLPYCLVYKIAFPTYLLGKMLVKIEHIGLVNILAGKKVVDEFIQGEADPVQIKEALELFITDPIHTAKVRSEMKEAVSQLGDPGCHLRAAKEVISTLIIEE
ncbi:MAG: lipid-A-disaccharide synthase [Rubritalea sp.]|jgi:lipid-A-disaccharide synthase